MSETNKNRDNLSEDNERKELLKDVEKAARRGANSGRVYSIILQLLPWIIVIGLFMYFVWPRIAAMDQGIQDIYHFENNAEEHDLVLEDNSVAGYTAADFENAILGDSEHLKKIEVYQQEVSDVGTITETGWFNWGVFTKNQMITYTGTAVYTVDLSKLSKDDIIFDEENHVITLRIPYAVQESINIPEDRIQFGDTNGGLLAFGDVKLTPEQASQVQAEARARMEQKLAEQNVLDTANRFAKLTVWEMYSPIIKGVAKDYSLEVEFK